jgi:PHP family Zn ribbon phosphoesterase
MKLDKYVRTQCSICKRGYETTDDESKLCPLCRMDAKEIFNTEMAKKLLKERRVKR